MKYSWSRTVLLIAVFMILAILSPEACAEKKLAESKENEFIMLDPNTGMMLRKEWIDENKTLWELRDSHYKPIKMIEGDYSYLRFNDDQPFIEIWAENPTDHISGLLNLQGEEIVPPIYDEVIILSERWQIGIMDEDGTENDYDFTFTLWDDTTGLEGPTIYKKFKSSDVFFDGVKIGTLNETYNTWFLSAHAYGTYLIVSQKGGGFAGIDSAFRIFRNDETTSLTEFYTDYADGMEKIYHSGTGQQAFIPGCTLKAEDLESPYLYMNGCIYDIGGNIIARTSREYFALQEFINGYANVCFDDKYGIIDISGNDIVPPAFDFPYSNLSNMQNETRCGYFSIVKNGLLGFVDLAGNVTCDFKYKVEQVSVDTPFAFTTDDDGYYIILSAAAGELPEHYSQVEYNFGAYEALVVTDLSGRKGIINLYGDTILPFSDEYDFIQITKDGTLAVAEKTTESSYRYVVFSLVETETDVPDPEVPNLPDIPDIPAFPDEPDAPALPESPEITETPVNPEEPPATEQPVPGDEPALHFCPSCGYKFTLPPIRFCPNCGMDLSPYLQ